MATNGIEVFKCLKDSEGKYAPERVLTSKYGADNIGERFVAFNEEAREYWVFANAAAFIDHITRVGPGPFHEVIFGWRAQKLKFDIDMKGPDATPETGKAYIVSFLGALHDGFERYFGQELPPDNIALTTSHGPGKQSFHVIIVGFHVADFRAADAFTKFLFETSEPEIMQYVDRGINKSTQNFRAPLCYKSGEPGRPKKIILGHSPLDLLICEIGPKSVLIGPTAATVGPGPDRAPIVMGHLDMNDQIVAQAVEKAKPWTTGCEASAVSRGPGFIMIYYRRIAPGPCKYCGPTAFHEKDNSPMIKITGSIWMKCRRAPSDAPWKPIWSLRNHIEGGGAIAESVRAPQPSLAKYLEDLLARHAIKIGPKNIYSARNMAPIELTGPSILIRAGMKMGKTNALVAAIEKWMSGRADGLLGARIIIVSFRQTFSAAIFEKFKQFGFVLYSDIKGPIMHDKVIVQIESISRLDISGNNRKPDLVILDESEAIFEQFDSGLIRNFAQTWSIFCWLMKWAEKVVCSDAYLADRTIKVLYSLRPQKMSVHFNTYQIAEPDNYRIYANKAKWLSELASALNARQKIAMPFSSLRAAETTRAWIAQKWPDRKVGFYSSKTSASVKRAHFADVGKFWAQYDVLIYTPTISAGVSFETAHYDTIFAYFTNLSCTTETCMQMIGRIRAVKTGQFNVFIEQLPEILPTTYEGIKADVWNARHSIWADSGAPMPEYSLDEEGRPMFHKSPHLTLWLENKMASNLSRTYFSARFIGLLAQYGAKYTFAAAGPGEEALLAALSDEFRDLKNGIADGTNREIANAADISVTEFQEIREVMTSQTADIAPEQKASYEKYKLRQTYDWSGPIEPEFVEKFASRAVRGIFKNIRALIAPSYDPAQYPGNATRLSEIRAREQNHFQYFLKQGDVGEQRDLNFQYSYVLHRALLTVIAIMGWTSPFDNTFKGKTTIYDNIAAKAAAIIENINSVPFEVRRGEIPEALFVFGPERDASTHLPEILGFINPILFSSYGIRVMAERTDRALYKIRRTHFIWDELIGPLAQQARREVAEEEGPGPDPEPEQPPEKAFEGV